MNYEDVKELLESGVCEVEVQEDWGENTKYYTRDGNIIRLITRYEGESDSSREEEDRDKGLYTVFDLQRNEFRRLNYEKIKNVRKISINEVPNLDTSYRRKEGEEYIDVDFDKALQDLAAGILMWTFIKANGEERVMNCTRNKKIIESFGGDIEFLKKQNKEPYIEVFDVDKRETRKLNVQTTKDIR